MRYPPVRTQQPERLRPGRPGGEPVLSTQERAGVRERVLLVSVASPDGQPYTLRLTATMAQLDAAGSTLHSLMLTALLVAALTLLAVQTWQARNLARRLGEITRHVDALRTGDLERTLAPERERDELAALRDVLAQATLALKRAQDAKERLLADAAHELRTPLTLMRTSLDLALRRERSSAELKTALADTREEVDRLAALASMLLDMASLAHEEQPRERHDLSQIVCDAVEATRAEAERRGLSLRYEGPAQLELAIRPEAVRRALDNLLSNALKYATHQITIQVSEDAGNVALRVRDDGPGIPESERELVFEPFHRVRGSAPGAGLGLAIVREVARSHGGRAAVMPSERGAELLLELSRV
jgi:signal transduction histidine kinase